MTFPLPLVPFEQYMLTDSTPEYPRAFVVEVFLSGSLDRAALEVAWPAALQKHPLLRSLVTRGPRGLQWTPTEAAPPAFDWNDLHAPITFAKSESIDVEYETGVRFWVRVGENEARLVFQFNHAACDGVGGLQFIGDLLGVYARQVSGEEAATDLVKLQPELLAGRGTFGLPKPTAWTLLRDITIGTLESLRLVMRKPLPVNEPAPNGPTTPVSYPGIESYTFTPEEVAELRRTAKQSEATLNDLLMCYLFQAIVAWNQQQSKRASHGWLRINVPTSLRRKEDDTMPAANVMSFTFIDRYTNKCQDGRTLLASIRDEMTKIKNLRLGLYFIGQLAVLAGIPKGMPLMVTGKRCFATAVLTNVGDPSRRFNVRFPREGSELVIGNMKLKNVTGSPPLRYLTRAGVAITTYAGQLSVSLQCDRHCFSQEQTRALLDTYIAQVRTGLSMGANGSAKVADATELTA